MFQLQLQVAKLFLQCFFGFCLDVILIKSKSIAAKVTLYQVFPKFGFVFI